MPLKPGSNTSEYRLTVVMILIGTVAEAAGGVFHSLQAHGVDAPWFPTALLVAGLVMQVSSLFGYVKGRAVLKAAALEAGVVDSTAAPTPPARPAALSPP